MLFNDRRKAKKAASATTKAQIGAMAKQGTLRGTSTGAGTRSFNRTEREVVNHEVRKNTDDFRPRKERYAEAANKVSAQADVNGFDGKAHRDYQDRTANKPQSKGALPKKKNGMM
jgi:hypothetical protein